MRHRAIILSALAGAMSVLAVAIATPAQGGTAAQGATPAQAAERPITYVVGGGSGEIRYDLSHPLHKVHGVSQGLAGRIAVAGGHLVTPATFELPLLTFDSGNASRDDNAALTLDVGRFPKATLEITSFKEASNAQEAGARVIIGEATGRLALHGVRRPVSVPVRATVKAGQVTVDATFPVRLTDYQIPRPSLLFQPVDDEVKVTVHALGQPR